MRETSKPANIKRSPLFYSSPSIEQVRGILRSESYQQYELFRHGITEQMFLNPSLSFQRQTWGELLNKLYNDHYERQQFHSPELAIAFLQERLTRFGLLLGHEIESIQQGEGFEMIDAAPKYAEWNELVDRSKQWKQEEKTVGLVHGSFDPTHIGHALLLAQVWPFCDVLLVGFDKDSILQQRKGSKQDPRPRFPLAARMWELASLPTPDHVFVLPVMKNEAEEYEAIYRQLGIKVLGSTFDNQYIESYRGTMARLGGIVISDNIESFHSSTNLIEKLSDEEITRRILPSISFLKEEANSIAIKAKEAGFLRDYPSGT